MSAPFHFGKRRAGGNVCGIEVEGHASTPSFNVEFLDAMAFIVGGVVDEHVQSTERRARVVDRRLEFGGTSDVDPAEPGPPAKLGLEPADQCLRLHVVHVDEGDFAPLRTNASVNVAPMPVAPPVMNTPRFARLG